MKRIYYLYLIIITLFLLLTFSTLFFFKASADEKYQLLGDRIIADFRKMLKHENADLLSLSLTLSENEELKYALIHNKTKDGYSLIHDIAERFREFTHIKTLRIQVLDAEFSIFVQSWSHKWENFPLKWYRNDLQSMSPSQPPKIGLETGRRLTFKSTIPLKDVNSTIGYLELIHRVDPFVDRLREQHINLFVLMDKQYSEKAVMMKNYPILKGYTIVNKNFNHILNKKAKNLDWVELHEKSYLYSSGYLYLLTPMYNSSHKEIGKFLIIVDAKQLEEYETGHEKFSYVTGFSDKALFNFVKYWESPSGSYKKESDNQLFEMLAKLSKEDRSRYIPDAVEILQKYSKDELIDIILENNYKEIKKGEIQ